MRSCKLCIWTFFISGAILTYDRLTSVNPGLDYIAVLVLKVLLVVWMVYVSGGLRRSGVSQTDRRAAAGMQPAVQGILPANAFAGSADCNCR